MPKLQSQLVIVSMIDDFSLTKAFIPSLIYVSQNDTKMNYNITNYYIWTKFRAKIF